MKYLIALMIVLLSTPVFAAQSLSNLSWTAPTTRVDGTFLLESEIKEYKVYYSIDEVVTTESQMVVVSGSEVSNTITLDLTPRAEPYVVSFAIATTLVDGLSSELSETVNKTFNVNSIAAPTAPTNLTFTITCTSGCTITEL
jgi:hypothetical protein